MTGAGLAFWNDPQTEEFILTESGWKSPSVSRRLSLESLVLLGKLLDALSRETSSDMGR